MKTKGILNKESEEYMSYKLKEFRKDSTVEVSGPMNLSGISELKEAFVKSLGTSTANIVFRPSKMCDDSYACLQLLCSTCKSSVMNGKSFLVKGKYAKPIYEMAMNAGFPSKMCREKKCGTCCLVVTDEELLQKAS